MDGCLSFLQGKKFKPFALFSFFGAAAFLANYRSPQVPAFVTLGSCFVGNCRPFCVRKSQIISLALQL